MILGQRECLTASFSKAETRKKPGSPSHHLGMCGECVLLCAWLPYGQMLICMWIVSQLVGLVNESSESCSRSLRARERGSVVWFSVWFASGIFLPLHGFTKFNFLPDSISLKNAVEFPHCTNLPGDSGSSFYCFFLHLHQVDTEIRADYCCFKHCLSIYCIVLWPAGSLTLWFYAMLKALWPSTVHPSVPVTLWGSEHLVHALSWYNN